ncbi:right-handed parallel beta-helix repeat-containing protein, partial [bacterium]|nr:right-handed parallel beta-helix repeat-containing protein [bacterium]
MGLLRGVRLSGAASGRIAGNSISIVPPTVPTAGLPTAGLDLQAAFTGRIEGNDIHGAETGVVYAVGTELSANRIRNNIIGITSSISSASAALGFVSASTVKPNEIYANGTGVVLTGARMQNQHVCANTTGVTGSGIIGGDSLELANVIEANTTGVANFTGTIQFNRFPANTTAINATSEQRILSNLFYRNTSCGVLVSGRNDVRIFSNTFYAPAGDNIRIQSSSSEVEVQDNILWAMSGYDIFVADDSRTGFFSDYNDLFASGTGKVGFYTKDFTDILDWQADIDRFDLHSIGATVVNPHWAEPQFMSVLRDDFRVYEPAALQRFTSPTVDSGNALSDNGQKPSDYTNRIANAGFESGLSGWETNTGSSVRSASPAAYEGASYFFAGSVEGGFARQIFHLADLGYTEQQFDSQDLEILFGGRIRVAEETSADLGEVMVIFRDAGGTSLATATATASGTSDRWELVGRRADIPMGTRTLEFVYTANRVTGGSADAYLDQAFLYIVSENQATDMGAYGHAQTDTALSGAPRINLRFPDLYVDWEKFKPMDIRWETFGNNGDSPVRIDLYRDTADGPAWVATITEATPDSGQFRWIPDWQGVDYATLGLRIQVSLAQNPVVLDRSQETFTVPESGSTYFVDDLSDTGDEYTPAATGDNRHTGKTAASPKPNPWNLFNTYELRAGSVLNIDTGDYPMIYSVALSGSTDRGLGIDEGFVMTGPTGDAVTATLHPAVTTDRGRALMDLNDVDFASLSNLTLRSAQRGILAQNDIQDLDLDHIEAWGHANEGIRVDTTADLKVWDDITVHDNSGTGLSVGGTLGGLSHV